MNILFFGIYCNPNFFNQIVSNVKTPFSVAQYKLEMSLFEGFQKNNFKINSAYCMPNLQYAKINNKLIQKKLDVSVNQTIIKTFPILNLRFFGKLFLFTYTFFKFLFYNINNLKEKPILFLTLNYLPISIPLILVSKIRKFKVIILLTDCARNTYLLKINKNDLLIKKIFILLKKFLSEIIEKSYSGYIFLTKYMNDIINVKQKPFLVIEGIYIPEYNKNSSTSFSQNIPTNKFTISYSGSLFKSYGIKKILEVMNYVDDDIELHIFGYGEYKDKVVEASSFDKRIIYNGFLLPHELSSQLSKSSLLLNIRNSSEEFTKLSFPSKIIDYMSTGVPVLTTKLDGIPDEYYDYVYSIDSFDSKIIGEKINEIKKIPNNKRIDLGLKAINFLENEKNTMLQTKKILDFLRSYNS